MKVPAPPPTIASPRRSPSHRRLSALLAASLVAVAAPLVAQNGDDLSTTHRLLAPGAVASPSVEGLPPLDRLHPLFDVHEGEPSWSTARARRRHLLLSSVGRHRQAEALLRQLLATTPENGATLADIRLEQAMAEFRRRDYERSRIYLNDAINAAPASGQTADVTAQALLWIAISHLVDHSQPTDKSLELLRDALEQSPTAELTATIHYVMGVAYEEKGENEEALRNYQLALTRNPLHPDEAPIRLRIVQCQIELDDTVGAASQLATLRARAQSVEDPENDTTFYDIHLLQGDFALSQQRYSDAESSFIVLVSSDLAEYRRAGQRGLADTYLAAGRADSAMAIYGRIIASAPDGDAQAQEAQYSLAAAQIAIGDTVSGATLLQRIAGDRSHPRRDQALLHLARISYDGARYDESRLLLDTLVATTLDEQLRGKGMTLIGSIQILRGEWDSAAATLTTALQQLGRRSSESRRTAQLLAAIALSRSGRAPEAIPLLNDHLATLPVGRPDQESRYWLGVASFLAGLYDASADELERLLRDDPGSPFAPEALYTIGWARMQQAKYRDAEFAFARLAKAYPLHARAVNAQLRRGDCLYALGDYEQAADLYGGIGSMRPSAEEIDYADYQKGMALFRARRNVEAHTALRRYVGCHAVSPLVPDALYLDALCALDEGESEQGLGTLVQALARSPRPELRAALLAWTAATLESSGRVAEAIAFNRELSRITSEPSLARKASNDIDRLEREIGPGATGSGALDSSRAAMLRARVYAANGATALAHKEFTRLAGATDPIGRPLAAIADARRMMNEGDSAGARRLLRGVQLSLDASTPPTIELALIDALEASRDQQAMAPSLDHLLARTDLRSSPASIRIASARVLARNGRKDEASRLLFDPADSTAPIPSRREAWEIALLRAETESADSARPLVTALAQGEDDVADHARVWLADDARHRGDRAAEKRHLEELLADAPWDPAVRSRARLDLARLLQQGGETKAATQLYLQLQADHCDDDYARAAGDNLKILMSNEKK